MFDEDTSNLSNGSLRSDVACNVELLDELGTDLALMLLPPFPHPSCAFIVGEASAYFDSDLAEQYPVSVGIETTSGLSLVARQAVLGFQQGLDSLDIDGVEVVPGDLFVLVADSQLTYLPLLAPEIGLDPTNVVDAHVLYSRVFVITATHVLFHNRLVLPNNTEESNLVDTIGPPVLVAPEHLGSLGLETVHHDVLDAVTHPAA